MHRTRHIALWVPFLLTASLSHIAAQNATAVGDILARARTFVGTPYRYGGSSPGGFDCSGFVTYLYRPFVVSLPRTSAAQARSGTSVDRTELRPGDLVFFQTLGPENGVTHVAIYLGEGMIIHSVSNGPQSGVVVNRLGARYWQKTYHNARRVFPETAVAEASPAASPASSSETPTEPAAAVASAAETAVEDSSSPWDRYDGPVYGDFAEWNREQEEEFSKYLEEEQKAFESHQ